MVFAWDYDDPTHTGFEFGRGLTSGEYSAFELIGANFDRYAMQVPRGQWWFIAVRATRNDERSGWSNELRVSCEDAGVPRRPNPVNGLVVVIVVSGGNE